MPNISIPENQIEEKLKEALVILAKIRQYQRIWYEHYGGVNRSNLRRWEDRADEFFAGLDIKIDKDEQENISRFEI